MQRYSFLRPIDRTVLVTLGLVLLFAGLYLLGPWYVESNPDGSKAPVFYLLDHYVWVLGLVNMIIGSAIVAGATTPLVQYILTPALVLGFLTRTYSLMGVVQSGDLLPPNYISHLATIVLLGAYWIYIRLNARD